MECPKCKGKVENKANVALLGLLGRVAFPKYKCPDCGSLKLDDFPKNPWLQVALKPGIQSLSVTLIMVIQSR